LTAKDQVRKPYLRRNLSSSAAVGGQFSHQQAAAGRTHNLVSEQILHIRLVLSCGLTRLSAIVVSLWLDRGHGTVCLSNYDNQTSALNNLGGYLRRICLAKDYGA